MPYGALPQIGQEYSDILKGKIMLDACNAVPARDGAVVPAPVKPAARWRGYPKRAAVEEAKKPDPPSALAAFFSRH